MDSDKANSLPDKSPKFSSRGDTKNDTHHPHDNDNPDSYPDSDVDESARDINNPPPSEPSTKDVEVEKPENVDQSMDKEEDPANTTDEIFSSPPDINQVSQDIDQFVSDLANSKNGVDESEMQDIPEFVEQFAFLVEAKIANYNSSDSPMRWSQLTEEDSSSFLQAVDRIFRLLTSLREFSSKSKYASSINRIDGILQCAMSYIEDEFRSLLEDYKLPVSDNIDNDTKRNQSLSSTCSNNQETDHNALSDTTNYNTPEEKNLGYSEEVVLNLNKLANAMMLGGYETECCHVYFISRRNALEENLHDLGFEKYCMDDVQKMQWEALEKEIVSWIKTFRQYASVHFICERNIANAVFSASHTSFSETLFSSLSVGVKIQLLNFAEAVAMTKRAAEKLFKFLDIYEALRDIIPTLEELFPVDCAKELKSETSLTRSRLGEALICIFCELENSIKADTGKTPVPGGAVHPLTRYIMNYLKYACEYKDTLESVFKEHQFMERSDSATRSNYDCNNEQAQNNDHNELEKQSPFERQITKVMDLLDTNLEAKSNLYKDPSLSLIFMMNNGRYILQKIRGSAEINSLLGDSGCRKRSTDLKQYHKNYQRQTWGKLLYCLTHEGLNVNGKVVKPVLKERFKSFNTMFDEIHKTQSTWVISDEQLQSELRVSISTVVIPAYRSFLARFSQHLTPGRQSEKYIKYQPEDIETYIDELFDGNAMPMGRKRP